MPLINKEIHIGMVMNQLKLSIPVAEIITKINIVFKTNGHKDTIVNPLYLCLAQKKSFSFVTKYLLHTEIYFLPNYNNI